MNKFRHVTQVRNNEYRWYRYIRNTYIKVTGKVNTSGTCKEQIHTVNTGKEQIHAGDR